MYEVLHEVEVVNIIFISVMAEIVLKVVPCK